MGRWTGEIEDFVKRFEKQLPQKKLALFVSTGKTKSMIEEKPDDLAATRKIDIDDKVKKFGLQPITIGFFGGVLNFNKMNFLTRKAFGGTIKKSLKTGDYKETEPSVYDARDWEEIRAWANDLASKFS
jgi:menaquinone-dependent protoporphyrinogen IX oxidase